MKTGKFVRVLTLFGIVLAVIAASGAHAQAPDSAANKFEIEMGPLHQQFLDHYASIYVTKVAGSGDMHGFNLLIGYDTTVLEFVEAQKGEMFYEGWIYEWEFFDGHTESPPPCEYGSCPTGLIRLTGIADLDNGEHHPLSLSLADGTRLCALDFHVTADTAFDCSFSPVYFFWEECGDNSLVVDVSPSATLAVSDTVYWWNNVEYQSYTPGPPLPGISGLPDSCLVENPSAARYVDFYDGGVEILCEDSIDRRGDITCNGIAYEIADFDMFLNFFRIGLPAFYNHPEASIAASDVNADGLAMTIADIYYLNGVIIGAFNPFPRAMKSAADTATLVLDQDLSTRTVSFDHPVALGAVCCVFDGEITPTFLVDTSSHLCEYYYNRDVTVVVILPPDPDIYVSSIPGIPPGPLFDYTGQGKMRLFDRHYRMSGGATLDGQAIPYSSPTQMIIQIDSSGTAAIAPASLAQSLARISDHETCTISISRFADHAVSDIDQGSLVINDSIVPLSVSIIPGSPDRLDLIVSARDFIRSYAFAYDSLGAEHRLPWIPVPADTSWNYVYSVHGQFADASVFTSLGKVTISNGPATIPVPSGWPTVGEAVAVAFPEDTVILADGVFSGDGFRDLDLPGKHVVLTSYNGPDATVIDCGGSETEYHYFARCVNSPADSVVRIERLTIRNAYTDGMGAVYVNNAAPVINHCRFEDNTSIGSGGAIAIVDASPRMDFCLFDNNHAITGGAIAASGTGAPYMANCTFVANSADGSGGGLYVDGAAPSVSGCLFVSGAGGGAVGLADGSLPPVLSCCDIYGNAGGDWTAAIADQLGANGNFSADPLFCDAIGGDYHLNGNSPCLPYIGDCQGLTGAFEAACGSICGDATGDQRVNIADVVYLINYIFKSGPAPANQQASDLNGNGDLDIGDAVTLIEYIFRSGPSLNCIY